MPDLFGVDIAGIVNSALSKGLLDLTLIVITKPAVDPNDPTAAPTSVPVNHIGKGVISDYSDFHRRNTAIQDGDREVMIVAKSLVPAVRPAVGNKLTIDGSTYYITGPVKIDAAEARYLCHVRR